MSRYGLWALFGPPTWVLWALVFACLGAWTGARRLTLLATTVGVLLVVAIYVLPTGFYLIRPLEERFPQSAIATLRPTDILVLAGGERLGQSEKSGHPEFREHSERVMAGSMLARIFPRARLWAVGGNRSYPGGPRDVDWMREAWRDQGIPASQIRIVDGTEDTCGNASGAARRMRAGARVALVTSAFHMPRSMACFRAAGLEPMPFPVDYQNTPERRHLGTIDPAGFSDRVDLALHEWVGLAYYKWKGRIDDPWPGPAPTRGGATATNAPEQTR